MKQLNLLLPLLLAAALLAPLNNAGAQGTDGKVTYTVQTVNYNGGYDPKHVSVVWVVNGSGTFVKTLCRHAEKRINYLYKWIASRGSYTVVDGVTGPTLQTQPQTHPVEWDCRDKNGAVVPDGAYVFRAEYTSSNAQGPYMASNCRFVKGATAVTTNFPNFTNGGGTFQAMSLTYTPYAEVAVTNIAPASGIVNAVIPVLVTVTNQTLNPATFSVAVSNVTAGTLIGTQNVTAMAGRSASVLSFNWNTAGLNTGAYQVRAVASKLGSETNTANNVLTRTVTLSAPAASDIAVLGVTPSDGPIDASVAISVHVTNLMASAAGAFKVALSNVTDGATLVATQMVGSIEGRASAHVVLAWNTAGLTAGAYQLLACAGPFTNETDASNNALTVPFVLRHPFHDLAVDRVTVPPRVLPNTTTSVIVRVTNRGDYAETFTNTLSDVTGAPLLIGTRVVANLAPYASTNVAFTWNTATNASFQLGYHTLQAAVVPVANEASLTNNTSSVSVVVASSLTTNLLITTASDWKYLDQGLDLSGAPWQSADYYDGFWASGAAPLGYGLPQLGTTISYGGQPNSRHTTTYFRRVFTVDAAPLSVTGRIMRAHGVVLYLNGAEIARQNMPDGAVDYSTFAASAVPRALADSYLGFAVPPSALVAGRNLLTAELHLPDASSSTAAFALELAAVTPTVPARLSVSPSALTPDGPSQSGDAPGVSVTLSNTGNTTASCLVLIRDSVTGAVLGTQTAGPLVPGESAVVRVPLSTFGAATGSRTLQAVTVVNGVTNLATIAAAPFTLLAPDFTPRTVAAAGSIGGRCNAVAVSGKYVYLGCGATLEIWDASVPATPVRRAALRLPGIIQDVAATSSWAYAATGAAGVQFVDVSSVTQPVHRATFDTTGEARQLTLSRNLLYVADGLGGVRILNVANPAAPALAGACQTEGPAQTVTLAASTNLFVLDSYSGLQILNAANPAAVTPLGSYDRVTAGLAATAVNGAVLVADANARLYRINITTSSVPTVATNALLASAARSLATPASGAALYAAAGAAGLLTLNPSTLALSATTPVGGEASDVAVAGTTLYVAAGFGGCRAFNISSPLAPKALATFAAGARAVDAAADGSRLFVAADEGGLHVHSLQNPSLPSLLATVTSVSNSRCVEVSYPLAFVGDGLHGLKIFNIANAAKPAFVGSYPAAELSHIRRIALAGSRALITDGRVLQLLSVANPAAPSLLATATNELGFFFFDLAAVGSRVYAACGNAGLRIYGLDSNLTLDNTVATPGPATGVSCVSNLLHVACGPEGWLTLSIAGDPASPALVSASGGMAFGSAAAGPLVYLADGARAGQAVNVSAPLTPSPVTNVTTLTQALRVRAASGLMLAAEDSAGLAILNASPGDLNLSGLPDSWEQQIANASIATNGPIRSVLDVSPFAVGPNGYTYLQSFSLGLSPTDPKSVPNRPPVFTVQAPATNVAVNEGASAAFSVTAQDDTGPTAAQRGLSNITWYVDGALKQETKAMMPPMLMSAFTFKTDSTSVVGVAFLDKQVSAVALDRMGASTQRVWTVRVFNVPLAQTITFKALPVMALGDTNANPGATATSRLPVNYASSNESVAQIVDGLIHITGAGTAVITASQPGSFDFKAAAPVNQTLTVKARLTAEVPSGGGTVAGAGLYVGGARVTLTATPLAGHTFLRWEDDSQAAARSYVMPSANAVVSAWFGVTTNVPQPAVGDPGAQRAMVGVPFSMPLDVTSASLPVVTVTGLPSGLTYSAAQKRIAGVPLVAVTNKLVTVTAKNVHKTPAVRTFTMTVDPLPRWASGTFSGAAGTEALGSGSASLSVTALGAATGKVTLRGTNAIFSAKSYTSRGEDGSFTLVTTAKVGKVAWPLTLAMNVPEITDTTGAVPPTLSKVEGVVNTNGWATMYRNIWKDAGMVTVLTNRFTGYYTASLPGGDEYGSGYLAFTVDKAGAVKTAGKLADGTAVSLSGTLLLDEAGSAFAVLYAAPLAYKGGGLFGVAEFFRAAEGVKATVRLLDGEPFVWDSLSPTATQVYGIGFIRELGIDGGWYDTVGNLYRYYAGKGLSASTDTNAPVPELIVGTNRYDSVWWDPDGLAIAVTTNSLGVMTGLAGPKVGAPLKVGVAYDYEHATNAVGLTVALTRPTGVFRGSFKAWFDYGLTHTSKTIAYEGILTPERENPADGIAGRGFFLWADKSSYKNALNATVAYPFNWSYDLKILLLE